MVKELGDRLICAGDYLLAVDTTYVTKPIGRMIGVQKWSEKDSASSHITQWVGHQWAICGFIARFGNQFRCFPVLNRLLSGQSRPFEFVVDSKGNAQPISRIQSIVSMITQVAESLPNKPLQVVADAFFSNGSFINPLIEVGLHLISRLRFDAVGFDDPVYCGRGRRPIRGKKWKLATLVDHFPRQSVEAIVYGKKQTVSYVSRVLWLRAVSVRVKVVAVVTSGSPLLLLSTDTRKSAKDIIEIYAARFSIETAIRTLKQSVGFGDYQLTTPLALLRFSWLCCCAMTIGQLILAKRHHHAWLRFDCGENHQIRSTSLTWLRLGLKRFVMRRILLLKSASGADLSKHNECLEALLKVAA